MKLDPPTARVVANAFILFVIPIVAVLAYWLGYDAGKTTGFVDGFLRRKG